MSDDISYLTRKQTPQKAAPPPANDAQTDALRDQIIARLTKATETPPLDPMFQNMTPLDQFPMPPERQQPEPTLGERIMRGIRGYNYWDDFRPSENVDDQRTPAQVRYDDVAWDFRKIAAAVNRQRNQQ